MGYFVSCSGIQHCRFAKKALFTLLLVVVLPPLLYAKQTNQTEKDQKTVIVQMSDPQFFYPESNRATDIPSEELADQALRYAERLKPDFVIVTGDLVQHRGNKDEIATFFRHFKKFDPTIPLYCVPGNHDLTHTSESIKEYQQRFGKDYYAFTVKKDRFLVLNSVLFGPKATKAKATAKQWAWFEKELKQAKSDKARYTIVFLHHPLFALTPNEPDGYYNIPLKPRRRLFHLFEQHGVDAVFAGHFHRNTVNQHRGIEYIVTGSVCAPVIANDPAGVRVIELGPEGIKHRYVKQADYKKQKNN